VEADSEKAVVRAYTSDEAGFGVRRFLLPPGKDLFFEMAVFSRGPVEADSVELDDEVPWRPGYRNDDEALTISWHLDGRLPRRQHDNQSQVMLPLYDFVKEVAWWPRSARVPEVAPGRYGTLLDVFAMLDWWREWLLHNAPADAEVWPYGAIAVSGSWQDKLHRLLGPSHDVMGKLSYHHVISPPSPHLLGEDEAFLLKRWLFAPRRLYSDGLPKVLPSWTVIRAHPGQVAIEVEKSSLICPYCVKPMNPNLVDSPADNNDPRSMGHDSLCRLSWQYEPAPWVSESREHHVSFSADPLLSRAKEL
jgi:hypothetical protein